MPFRKERLKHAPGSRQHFGGVWFSLGEPPPLNPARKGGGVRGIRAAIGVPAPISQPRIGRLPH
ncbi:hypothetical protein CHELA20_53250 [Hyphomicrobiales bacterium]|nr:hypothetical protein CHELA41_21673 [Hyphomicrobiales bacterium]CAH1683874.1 hypothetical protein CHELA20_53250 [Hyphomicrobiales bacterium]